MLKLDPPFIGDTGYGWGGKCGGIGIGGGDDDRAIGVGLRAGAAGRCAGGNGIFSRISSSAACSFVISRAICFLTGGELLDGFPHVGKRPLDGLS